MSLFAQARIPIPLTPAMALADVPVCVVDVETTGSAIEWGDRVTELGIIRIENGLVTSEFERLTNPGKPVSKSITALTGITNEMLHAAPSFAEAWDEARPLLDGAVIVGHNVGFDIGFLHGEVRRLGKRLNEEIGDAHVLDTVRLARKQFGRGGNGLQSLARRLDIKVEVAHRALPDCRTTATLLKTLLEPHGQWQVTLSRAGELQGGASRLGRSIDSRPSLLPEPIADAMLTGQSVRIGYIDADNIRSDRAITPFFVRKLKGHLTLIAHCHAANDQRMFRVDRILLDSVSV